MRSLFLRMLAVAVGLALSGGSIWAQNMGTEVKFESIDHVELKGTYYKSTQGKKACTVLLLHDIDHKASSKSEAYVQFAEELNKAGYAVLTFDFRGHGESTGIDKDSFWNFPANRQYVNGYNVSKPKESITSKDFKPGYLPTLVNDVMAAKMWLDRKNDEAECNSRKLIVVGAGEGATLGMMWAYSECFRFNQLPTGAIDKKASRDIAAIVSLCMSPTLGTPAKTVPVKDWLKQVGIKEKIPVVFYYGGGDKTNETLAKRWLKDSLDIDLTKRDADRPFTWYVPVTKEAKLSGQALVSKNLPTIKMVTEFIKAFAKDENADTWDKFEADKNVYVWQFPRALLPAKPEKAKSVNPLPLVQLGVP